MERQAGSLLRSESNGVTTNAVGLSGKRTMQTLRINPAGEEIVVTNEEQLNLDISSLPPGFYIAELLDSKGKLRGKILKQ